ncbi:hypothetical protein QYV87_004606 [Vibrio parahaemolyticus]|nr:hypothetical protein [Vibrio parahaemolyticus]
MPFIDQWARLAISFEFDSLEQSYSLSARTLMAKAQELESNFNELVGQADEEHRSEYADVLQDEHQSLTDDFPKFQRFSHFILAYSLTEATLNRYCRYAQKRYGFKLSLKDLSGQGIERARNYLIKVVGISPDQFNLYWSDIKLAADIRNVVTHTGGELTFENSAHLKLAKRLEGVETVKLEGIDELGGHIRLTDDYVIGFIRTARIFLSSLGAVELS